jgi:hypothetical protein
MERDFWSGNHPLGHSATASLPYRIERMAKEKKRFATERPFSWPWDTILLIKEAGGPMFVRGTDVEVEWCPVTKMFWEV